MNLKTLAVIIPMISVAVMIVWGFVGNAWNISWLAVVCGGIAAACIRIADKNRNDNSNDNSGQK